ncbi:MAG: gluconate 2-dehydrogenase subunit 3 family protein [Longimicrobiaceae bacterium]
MSETFQTPFAGYDVLGKRESPSWNEQTRAVVFRRLQEIPERRFLDVEEWQKLEAVASRLLPQPDRPGHPVPIAPWIDWMLDRNQGEGYRYADVPPLREAWRLGLRGIEEESVGRYGRRFVELAPEEQDAVLGCVQRGEVRGESWRHLAAPWFFTDQLLKTVVATYYSHPAAWSEIGFGGPASPRGYVRLGFDQRDPWEAEERP